MKPWGRLNNLIPLNPGQPGIIFWLLIKLTPKGVVSFLFFHIRHMLAKMQPRILDNDTQTGQSTSCLPVLMHPLRPTLAARYVVIQPAIKIRRDNLQLR